MFVVFKITANISCVLFDVTCFWRKDTPGHCWLLWIWGWLTGIDRFWCLGNVHFSQDLLENKTQKQTWPNITSTKHQFPHSYSHPLLVSCYKEEFTFHTSKCLDLLITHRRVAAAASGIAGKRCNGDRHSHHQEIKQCQYCWKALAQSLVEKD